MPAAETNTECLIEHHFLGAVGQLRNESLMTWDCLPLGKCSVLFLLQHILDMKLHTSNISAKTTIDGLTKHLIYHHGIPHSIASDQGTHFTANKVRLWAHVHGMPWSYDLEVSALIKTVEWTFEDSYSAG